MRLRTMCVLLVVIAVNATSYAQQGGAKREGDPNSRFESQFRRWDRNADGALTRDELPAAVRGNFGRVDQNKNGFISLEEHVQFLSRGRRDSRLPPGVEVRRNLPYVTEGHPRQVLDVYLPAKSDSLKPVVIWIHGGAWRQGSKDQCPALPLLERGFVVASLNYRLSQHAVFPAQIHDCKAAIRWLKSNHRELGINPERVGVWGSSAGGHLVALVGTSADVPELEGELGHTDQSSRVHAVCDWFGPTDLLMMNRQAGSQGTMDHDAPNSPESQLLGGPLQTVPERARVASPLTYISEDDPEFLIIHGDADRLVPWQQSEMLHNALRKVGVKSEFQKVKDAGHGRFRDRSITESTFRFFTRVLQERPSDELTSP